MAEWPEPAHKLPPRETRSSRAAELSFGVQFWTPMAGQIWKPIDNNGERITVPASPRLLSDDLRTLKSAAEAGLGILLCEWE
jgi:ABC-type amino acid transport substrate-binding protein